MLTAPSTVRVTAPANSPTAMKHSVPTTRSGIDAHQ